MTLLNSNSARPAVLAVLISLMTQVSFSQAFTRYSPAGMEGAYVNYKIEPFSKEIEGSPYYQDDWNKGTIYNRNNTFTEFDQMKYNLHIDELVFIHEGTQYIIPNKAKIQKFTLGKEEFIGAFDGKKYSFFRVFEPGAQLMLLKNFQCEVEKGSPSKGYIPATKDKYVRKEKIYLMKPGHDAVEISPRKGLEVIPYLHDKHDEMEAFIKAGKLKMKKVEDLLKVVRHYNSLARKS